MKALNTKEAAEYLGIRPQTLHNWRTLKKGPDYIKMGSRVIYRLEDLNLFIQANKETSKK